MNKENKKVLFEEIRSQLKSSEDVLVADALTKIDKHGDHTLLEPLLHAYINSDEGENRAKMVTMLSSLKISEAEDTLIDALLKEEFIAIRRDILSFIWNSGFQPIDHIHTITAIAINGDYLTALEALTVIENIDEVASEEHVLEASIEIRNYLNENQEDDKRDLIKGINEVIQAFTLE